MNYIRSTCRDCGHVEQKPREVIYTHDPSMCRHEVVDRRGSSRSISRTFCKQCGTFIVEVPGESHAQRRAAAARVSDATSNTLDVINAMTSEEAVTDYSPEAVEAILSAFNDRVLQAIQDEERVDDITLHDHLREAIVKTMEDPDFPWNEVSTRGASPTPVAMMVYDTTGMPYSKAKAKAYDKRPRAVIWPPGHPHAPDAQASHASQPSGKGKSTGTDSEARTNLMIAHWEAFANRLLRKLASKHMFQTMRVERCRRAIIMRENVACRTLIRASPQCGPLGFRPIDIYDDSQSEEEPTGSVAPAASDAPSAAPAPGYLPPPVIGRALDVLNAPGSTREKFQALLNSRNLGPGDMEDLSPKLCGELRLDSAEAEHDLLGRAQAEDLQGYLPLPGEIHQFKRFPEPP